MLGSEFCILATKRKLQRQQRAEVELHKWMLQILSRRFGVIQPLKSEISEKCKQSQLNMLTFGHSELIQNHVTRIWWINGNGGVICEMNIILDNHEVSILYFTVKRKFY